MLEQEKTKEVKEVKVDKKSTQKEKSYLEVFNDNYSGRSEQAKELEKALKKRDTGKTKVSYIPWATMIRMATQQDPEFILIKELSPDGSFVHYHGRKTETGYPMDDPVYFVKVTATFMGKTMSEEYPVQDFSFEPVSFKGRAHIASSGKTVQIAMDANIVNKALQRATAKVLSELTGLGLSLYESGDLQFEDDTEKGVTPTTKRAGTSTVVKTDPKTGEVQEQAGISMITKEQLVVINDFAKDEKKKLRLDRALQSYKAASYEGFTEAQAKTIITALTPKEEGK